MYTVYIHMYIHTCNYMHAYIYTYTYYGSVYPDGFATKKNLIVPKRGASSRSCGSSPLTQMG